MRKLSSVKDDFYNFAVGFCMGSANVIPGVSGGTMLFIMGAFSKLTGAIADIACAETLKNIVKGEWKKLYDRIQWRFLFGIGLGTLISIATMAKLFVWLLEYHTQLTFAFFFGLIAASIITVNRQIKKWSIGAAVSFFISALIAAAIIFMVPVNGGTQWYMLLLYGAICIIAMILPGLSGSFLLLILGQYERVWLAVSNLLHFQFTMQDISTVIFLGAGAVIGLGSFVHLLNYLLKKFYNVTIAALIGFMAGAIPRLWPWQHEKDGSFVLEQPFFDRSAVGIIAAAAAGLVLVMIIEFFARRKNIKE